ncbi:MAG: tol-pal system-associated acyl-CoA thioesterase [Alphaproteobacteria bacterium]|nr:tol-pal system-associated acyl-CoA thioesterase [Alphaproteobacteria bacterium]
MNSTNKAIATKFDPHHFPVRVYYEDTDAGGVVYHANYLKFAERARTELLRENGHNQRDLLAEHHVYLVVRHLEAEYKAPARLDDLIDVETEFVNLGAASVTAKQILRRDAVILAEIKTVIVSVTPEGKVARLPPQLRQIFGR